MNKLAERFNEKVSISDSGCWMWIAATDANGYGKFGIGRKAFYAHRVSWEIHNGPIPEGMFICHRCDTPGCVNPSHLFIGTQSDNMRDCAEKGRAVDNSGEKSPAAKLNANDVLEIRAASGTHREIASKYHINHSQVTRIKGRKLWASVP